MAAVLSDYLAGVARKPWRWGECDCVMIAAGWAHLARGVDPAARWRGAYSDRAGCDAIIAAAGGLFDLMDEGLRAIGVERCAVARDGDIGLVQPDGAPRPVAAIAVDGFWAMRMPRGVHYAKPSARAVWRV